MSKPTSPQHDESHWYNIFHRTKVKVEKKKLFQALLESSNQLTVTVSDQSHVITKLTNTNEDLTRQLAAANDSVTEAIEAKARIKAKQSVLKETLENLQTSHNAINSSLKQQITSLEDRSRNISRDHEHVTQKVKELEQQAKAFKDKIDQLTTENKLMGQEQETLRKHIQVAEKATLEESLKFKMLQKEIECNADQLERTVEERNQLQRQMVELKELLYTTQQEKREIEQELGCQNETLKFEVAMLARALQRTKAKIEKLQKDKEIIISYYQDKKLSNTTSKDMVYPIGQITSHEDGPTSTFMPEYPHVEYLQNKVFGMESQIFNQSQMIQELSNIISEYDPSFNITQNSHLKVYIDSEPLESQLIEQDCSEKSKENTDKYGNTSKIDEAYISMATEIDQTCTLMGSNSDSTMASTSCSYHDDLDDNGNVKSDHVFQVQSSSSLSSF